jgi:hypothetical protein
MVKYLVFLARRGGPTEKADGVARRRGPTEKPAIPNGQAGQTDTRMGAQRRMDVRPTEGAWVPNGDRELPDGGLDVCLTEGGVSGGGPTAGLGGGPTGDYIRAGGPPFWALSSCAQSHLQEMRERRVLMSESAEIPKGMFSSSLLL